MTPGHRRLADGSLLRIDIEHGQYVGRLYGPDRVERKIAVSASIDELDKLMAGWCEADMRDGVAETGAILARQRKLDSL